MASKRRPRPVRVDDLRCYATRGPRDDGRWYWRITLHRDGLRRDVATGWWLAREVGKAAAQMVADGLESRAALQANEPQIRTLKCVLRYWLGHQRDRVGDGIKPATFKAQKHAAKQVARFVGDTAIGRFGGDSLERLRDDALRAGLAPNSVRHRLLPVARQAWLWAQRRGWVDARPLPVIHVRARKAVITDYTPTREEAWTVIDAMREGYPDARAKGGLRSQPRWVTDALTILLATGLRVGELAAAQWTDVDLEAGVLDVRPGKTKQARRVPLSGEALKVLRSRPRSFSGLFDRTAATVRQGLRLALRRFPWAHYGLTRWTPHGLRRAAVNAVCRHTGDPSTAAAMMGHSAATALRYYRQVTLDDMQQAAARAGLGERTPSVVSLAEARSRRR